jgi:hypothetical protein
MNRNQSEEAFNLLQTQNWSQNFRIFYFSDQCNYERAYLCLFLKVFCLIIVYTFPYASVPYAYAQHAYQFLTHMLSMVCRDLYNEWPLEKWKTDAYAQHTHQFLTRMLSMPTSSLRVCSACAPVPDAYAQHTIKARAYA